MPGEPVRWSEVELRDHMRRIWGDDVEPAKKVKVRSIVPRGRKMNKTEAAYDAFLCAQEGAGAIIRHRYESITLLLADGCRYTPDFEVVYDDIPYEKVAFHEVKGTRRRKSGVVGPYMEDDARVKLLTAARLYPEFTFRLAWLDQGRWQVEEISR